MAVTGVLGLIGFAAGPDVHVIDVMALTDPLLARLRYRRPGEWRPGHLERQLPRGYLESLERRVNVVHEVCARNMLDDLWLITRGPLCAGRAGRPSRAGT